MAELRIVECHNCFRQFRDDDTGVCPECGSENTWDDDDDYPLGKVIG